MRILNKSLCESCQGIFAENFRNFLIRGNHDSRRDTACSNIHHLNGENLAKAVADGCCLCSQILDTIRRDFGMLSETSPDVTRRIGRLYYDFSQSWTGPELEFRAEKLNALHLSDMKDGFSVSFDLEPATGFESQLQSSLTGTFGESTSSDETLELAKRWLVQCSETHTLCQRADPIKRLPTRLVEVSTLDSVDGDEGISIARLKISTELSLSTRYTTLSHCWGGKMPFMLVSSNIHHLMDRIVVSELPITFQHAIAITKRLGIRYIWIDSLCIIQDSEDDWRRESSTMNQVYQFGYCNIAAAAASNSSEGCFFKRSPIAIEPLIFELDRDIPDLSPGHYFLRCMETWRQDLQDAPLSKRGWVVQERMLAQRVLYFTQRQIYFECRNSTLSEMNSSIPRSVSFFLAREVFLRFDKEKSQQRHANAWQIIVEYYSACALTREEDKLVAIAGVAKEVQRLTGWKYLAGIWEQNLIFDLLWFSQGRYNRLREANPYLAPSWTWASARGKVTFNYNYLHGVTIKDTIFIQIVGVHVSTKGGDEMAQVTDGFLKVIGRPTPAELRRNHQPTRMTDSLSNDNIYIGGENTFIDFYPDDLTYDPPRNVWCLPVYWWHSSLYQSHLAGLILVKTEDTINSSVFSRVGLFRAKPERMHYLRIPHGMPDSEYSDELNGVSGSEIVPAARRHSSSTLISLPAEKLITII